MVKYQSAINEKTTIRDVCNWIKKNESNVWDEYISVFEFPSNIDDKTFYSFIVLLVI